MIIQVWLRTLDDTNGHPAEREVYRTDHNISYRKMALDYAMKRGSKTVYWHGFTFNPGIKRKSDHDKIGSYSSVGEGEVEVNWKYRELGYYATILEQSAVRHIGWGRHNQLRQPKEIKNRSLVKKALSRVYSYVSNKK